VKNKPLPLMVYVDDPSPTDECMHVLSSLQAIDMIVLRGEAMADLCRDAPPAKTYRLEGSCLTDYSPDYSLSR